DGIRYFHVTGVQTCTLPICLTAEIAQVLDMQADLFEHLAMDGLFYALSGLDKACQGGIAGRGVGCMPCQQYLLAALYKNHHGRRSEERRIRKERGARLWL